MSVLITRAILFTVLGPSWVALILVNSHKNASILLKAFTHALGRRGPSSRKPPSRLRLATRCAMLRFPRGNCKRHSQRSFRTPSLCEQKRQHLLCRILQACQSGPTDRVNIRMICESLHHRISRLTWSPGLPDTHCLGLARTARPTLPLRHLSGRWP